jgi:glycerol transport system ATP-binding protein
VLFDEPLTVIDPHLKWQLRRKLKQIHHELKLTLVYVTHDQVEALTFADQVVVMTRGRAVQIGTASDLFERPQHTFVGHFIGSPGMNFLPARWSGGALEVAGHAVPTSASAVHADGPITLGVRPEYVQLAAPNAEGAVPALVTQAQDIGTYWLVTARVGGGDGAALVRARLRTEAAIPAVGDVVWLSVVNLHSCFYRDETLIAMQAEGVGA